MLLSFLLQIAEPVSAPAEMSFGWLLVKTLLAMTVILSLAVLFIKYLMPKLSVNMSRSGSQLIKILDRLPVDARRSLLVIEVNGQKSLVGLSDAGFTHLMKLDPKGE
ncbi:MAG: hypothetical protein ACD_73C00315G0005 [uncultured bacterium]|nr:MAG: hypothetical protein ACD_73C00315G0005 [uncultured bacterium]